MQQIIEDAYGGSSPHPNTICRSCVSIGKNSCNDFRRELYLRSRSRTRSRSDAEAEAEEVQFMAEIIAARPGHGCESGVW